MMQDHIRAATAAPLLVFNKISAYPDKASARQAWGKSLTALSRLPQAQANAKIQVKASADGSTAEIMLFDEIGYYGVSASDFIAMLADVEAPNLNVRINSPGGDVFDGIAMYNALKNHPAKVTTTIEGWAASAASVVAMGGDEIVMLDGSMLMCHCAWTFAFGNSANMAETAGILGKIDKQLAGIYSAKSGKSSADCLAMMTGDGKDDGTWFSADEAKAFGLVDVIADDNTEDGDPAGAAARAAKQAPRNDGASWQCAASDNLPVVNSDTWDGPAAAERMLAAAGFNGDSPDPEKAKKGFLAFDSAAPKLKGSYKLPFADIVDGSLQAVDGGIDAAASRLPQTDIPQTVKNDAQKVLDTYKAKMKSDDDDTSAAALEASLAELASARRRLQIATHE